ncbi:uncharacterized protein LOC101236113 isoform X1 [Hydra vulgaris]|uniref:uncharacterized protein LOC101236113 isoform X1 n=1 Tax=Hydra vulgaris TaxID=6087 RepID=UPI001F5F789A|nr:uncharacterized protein LOC101236113 [Hydra vulgaris]
MKQILLWCFLLVSVNGKIFSNLKTEKICEIPKDIDFPECENKVLWMKANWKTNPLYIANGVDGSLCSIINYLSEVETICPCSVPNDESYLSCNASALWMKNNWKFNSVYKMYGVDGSMCSILYHISQIEKKCPKENCRIVNNHIFPLCKKRVLWMQAYWKTNPIYKLKGVDGSKCSIVNYLSKVEKVCPCNTPNHPLCQDRILEMVTNSNWKRVPFYIERGYDGSLCSILSWLTKVEKICPLL